MTDLPPLAGLQSWLDTRAALVPMLRPDCGDRLVWADDAAPRKAPLSLVSIHGFSASPRELSPVPERIAKALGAHYYAPRMRGHGQDGAAMGRATSAQWRTDVALALKIGAALGEKTIIMGCSTGCPLICLELAAGGHADAVILVSPNFGLYAKLTQFALNLPWVGLWGPWVYGKMRHIEPINDRHSTYWTTDYPMVSLLPMAQTLRDIGKIDVGQLKVPALFAFSKADTVTDSRLTMKQLARWGGPATGVDMVMGPGDDARAHLVAGDTFSPGQNDMLVETVLGWCAKLGLNT
ncbi:MAG: alpha/beta fold hydrolase [Rhodobacteraceae bacterium]|nr:alpha/beta fold hydrolase [Paracoccaceae bacterium]